MFSRQRLAMLCGFLSVVTTVEFGKGADYNWTPNCLTGTHDWYCCYQTPSPLPCYFIINWNNLAYPCELGLGCPPYPNPATSVDLGGSSVTLSGSAQILSLELTGNFDINAGGGLTVGTVENHGHITVNSPGYLTVVNFNNYEDKILELNTGSLLLGDTLTNHGEVDWSNSAVGLDDLHNLGVVILSGTTNSLTGTLNNDAVVAQNAPLVLPGGRVNNHALYQIQDDVLDAVPRGSFHNYGTLRKLGSANVTISSPFHGEPGSTVEVVVGTLEFNSDDSEHSGCTYLVPANASVLVNGFQTLNGTLIGVIDGDLVLRNTVLGGPDGATMNFTHNGATSPGTSFRGGPIGLTNAGLLNITGAINSTSVEGAVYNSGTLVQTSPVGYGLYLTPTGVLHNSGVYEIRSGDVVGTAPSVAPLFENTGTLRKTTSSSSQISGVNMAGTAGTIDVQEGTLAIHTSTNATHQNGTYSVASGATLLMDGGPGTTHQNGTYVVASGGTLEFTANNIFTGLHTGAIGGSLNFRGTLLAGAGGATLNFTGAGAQMTGTGLDGTAGALTNAGLLNVTGAVGNTFVYGGVYNSGTLVQTSPTNLGVYLVPTGVLHNSGVYEVRSGDIGGTSPTAAPLFENTGILRKTTPTSSQISGVKLTGTGATFEAQGGALAIHGSDNSMYQNCTYSVASGASLVFQGGVNSTYQNGTYAVASGGTMEINPGNGVFTGLHGGLIDGALVLRGTQRAGSAGATLSFNGAGAQMIGNTLNGVDGPLTNTGLLTVAGVFTGTLIQGNVYNSGTLVQAVTSDQGVSLGTTAIIHNSGVYELRGGYITSLSLFATPLFDNTGTLRKTTPTSAQIFQMNLVNNGGIVEVLEGNLQIAALTQNSGITRLAGGSLQVSPVMSMLGGSLTGYGTVTGTITNSAGTVAPGLSPGLLTVMGNYNQGSAAELSIEIGGLIPGSQYDRLDVSGNAALNGALRVTFINGFVPTIGDSLTVMTYGSKSGSFSNQILPCNLPGRAAQVSVGPTSVVLTIIAATNANADLNCDCAVTPQDVTAFILALLDPVQFAIQFPGCPISRADLNGDGFIDGRDIKPFVAMLVP